MAIVRTVEHFHTYLYGCEFLIRIDHAALTWLLQMKNSEGQMARWLERLKQYHFKIRHRADKLHNNADSLSRRPCKNCKHCDKIEQGETSFNCGRTAVADDEEWTTAQLRKDQEEDVDIGPLLKWKENVVERPAWSKISDESPSFKALWAQWESLRVENGLFKRAWESPDGKHTTIQLVVPATRVKEVLLEMHNGGSGGHFEISKTLSKVRERFYWVRCRDDVQGWYKKWTEDYSERADATIQRWFAFRKDCSGHSRSFPGDRGRQ